MSLSFLRGTYALDGLGVREGLTRRRFIVTAYGELRLKIWPRVLEDRYSTNAIVSVLYGMLCWYRK